MLLAALIRVVLQGLSLFRFGAGERLGVNVDIEVPRLHFVSRKSSIALQDPQNIVLR